MLVYLGLAEHLRVPWLVWENVPGVLSSNGGRDFGTFLGALGELGYRWSFRVLDAQHFGVPQRRRRVFVVAHLGNGPHPASVLFESASLRGDTAKGGKARQGAPRGAGKGAPSGGRIDCSPAGIAGTVSCKWVKSSSGPAGDEHYNMVVQPLVTDARGLGDGLVAPTLRAKETLNDYTPLLAQFFDEQASGSQYGTGSVASTCSKVTGTLSSRATAAGGLGTDFEVASGLQAQGTMAVRRLLPVECERLQGFPDDWTNIPWRGKPAPDGPRYKSMGNSMAVPVMRWIGQRLDRVAKGDL